MTTLIEIKYDTKGNKALSIDNNSLSVEATDIAIKLIKTNAFVHAIKMIRYDTNVDLNVARNAAEFLRDVIRNVPTPNYSASEDALAFTREVNELQPSRS